MGHRQISESFCKTEIDCQYSEIKPAIRRRESVVAAALTNGRETCPLRDSTEVALVLERGCGMPDPSQKTTKGRTMRYRLFPTTAALSALLLAFAPFIAHAQPLAVRAAAASGILLHWA